MGKNKLGLFAALIPLVALAADNPGFTPVQPDLFALPGALTNAWADYDNDGDLDLVVGYEHGVVKLFRNDNGVFTDVTLKAGLGTVADAEALKPIEIRAAAWGDYDGDGRLDLYLGTRNATKAPTPLHRSYLYHNNGDGTFTEVAQKLGVDAPGADARQASWIDLDHDGRLDLFLADRSGHNRMFHNDGGAFTDIAKTAGLENRQFAVGACWFDMNKDGRLDVFVANQDGGTDAFYRNNGDGTFTDIAPAQHMDHPGRAKDEGGVGCSVGDYDNDGNLDIYVATYGEDFLYHNNGDGTFTDVAHSLGISGHGHMVGASWGDFDNDGLLDVFVSGYSHDNEADDRLYRNTGKGFVNVITPALNHSDHGVQWADYDKDGALDISLADDFSKTAGRHYLVHNNLPEAARKRSLQVMVLDAKGTYAPGSEVRLFDAGGKLLGTRLVNTGDGYSSQSVTPVHFGLAVDAPVTVEVTYLTAKGRVTQRLTGVRPGAYAGKTLTVRQNP